METKTYPLRRGAAERVELTYDKGFKNIVLRLDGQELATYPNKSALKDPQTFPLEDGSTLQIRFKRGLDLRLNGHALPGSTHDAMNYLRNAYGAAYAIAILNILFGLIVLVAAPSFLEGFSPIGLLIAGVIYGALGYFIQRQSMIALAVATVLYCLDTVYFLWMQGQAGPSGAAIGIRVAILVGLFQGFGALRSLKQERQATAPPSPEVA